jgi:FdhD protein
MTRRFPIHRVHSGSHDSTTDSLAVEEPLALLLNGQPYAILMRTPGEDEDLVTGFLYSESLIESPTDIASLAVSAQPDGHQVAVQLAGTVSPPLSSVRSTLLSSSCGVCGRTSIQDLLHRMEAVESFRLPPEHLLSFLPAFEAAQRLFPATGGVHAAALFSPSGGLLDLAEDVGRHNALDKLLGRALRRRELPLRRHVLVMSSRASFDILQKAALAGIPVVASMGAASSLAADLARAAGIQLCCFLRSHGVVEIRSSG